MFVIYYYYFSFTLHSLEALELHSRGLFICKVSNGKQEIKYISHDRYWWGRSSEKHSCLPVYFLKNTSEEGRVFYYSVAHLVTCFPAKKPISHFWKDLSDYGSSAVEIISLLILDRQVIRISHLTSSGSSEVWKMMYLIKLHRMYLISNAILLACLILFCQTILFYM